MDEVEVIFHTECFDIVKLHFVQIKKSVIKL